MNIDTFLKKHSLHRSDITETVQAVCPKFSKIAMTMCCNPDYGVQLSPVAAKAVRARYEKPDVRENHRGKTRWIWNADAGQFECDKCGAEYRGESYYCYFCGREVEM